ncbi:MAG: hypothetical protein ABW217_02710, partial [Polyangiaceae bacterium]
GAATGTGSAPQLDSSEHATSAQVHHRCQGRMQRSAQDCNAANSNGAVVSQAAANGATTQPSNTGLKT